MLLSTWLHELRYGYKVLHLPLQASGTGRAAAQALTTAPDTNMNASLARQQLQVPRVNRARATGSRAASRASTVTVRASTVSVCISTPLIAADPTPPRDNAAVCRRSAGIQIVFGDAVQRDGSAS